LDNQALGAIPLSNVHASLNVLSGEWIYNPGHRDEVNVLSILG